MAAFITRMPGGFAGRVTRDVQFSVIENEVFDASSIPTLFGLPVKAVSGKMQLAVTGATVAGFCVRPDIYQSATNTLGNVAPVASTTCNRLRQGYFAATCSYGSPAIDGIVYIRLDTGGNGGTVGQLEATSDTSHNEAIPGAYWTGPADSSNVAEIRYNL